MSTGTADRFDTFIRGVFKYHGKQLDTNVLDIYRKALRHIPFQILEDFHERYIGDASKPRGVPPLVADFTAHWRQHEAAIREAKAKKEVAELPVSEYEARRVEIIRYVCGYLNGAARPVKLKDAELPEFAKTIIKYTVQRFRADHPQGLPGRLEEDLKLIKIYTDLANRLYSEQVADNFSLEGAQA